MNSHPGMAEGDLIISVRFTFKVNRKRQSIGLLKPEHTRYSVRFAQNGPKWVLNEAILVIQFHLNTITLEGAFRDFKGARYSGHLRVESSFND
jgi:hypothetical protein